MVRGKIVCATLAAPMAVCPLHVMVRQIAPDHPG